MKLTRLALAVIAVGGLLFLGWRTLRSTPTSESTHDPTKPYPCARFSSSGPNDDDLQQTLGPVGGITGKVIGDELHIEPSRGESFTFGVVADARGTFDHLPHIREHFASKAATLVVSLGGMGQTERDIEAALSALSGPWLLVSLPGDRESFPDHERVCDRLPDTVSGARVRQINVDSISTLFTFPGAPSGRRLIAGNDGCRHTAVDAEVLASHVAATGAGMRVMLSHTPPRQRGAQASDRSAAGVHIGDRGLASAITRAGISLALHGLEAHPDIPREGARRLDPAQPVILGAGSADGLADVTRHGKWPWLAMLVTIESGNITWEYVERRPIR